MDTPQVKFALSYHITVDENLTAVTAANFQDFSQENGKKTFNSSLDIPIPAYLVAFAAGNIACR